MNSQEVFEIIAKMKDELISWDELNQPTDPARKSGALSTLEELESRLRERCLILNEPIVCQCGCLIESSKIYENHKLICEVANR